MGINVNSGRNSLKKQKSVAKAAAEAYNKSSKAKATIAPIISIGEVAITPIGLGEDKGVEKIVELVDAVEAQKIESDGESPEDTLRYELSTMKKFGLKEYADENGVDLGSAKTNGEIIDVILDKLK